MKLTAGSTQGILDHIRRNWGEKGQCPKCYKSANYSFKGADVRVFALSEYHGGTFMVGGDTVYIPVVPIFCKSCGYVELLNVNILDEARKEKPTEEEKP